MVARGIKKESAGGMALSLNMKGRSEEED